MVSKNFIAAVKLNPKRDYKIAQEAGVHPCILSRIINGIDQVQPGDKRVLAVGKVLGLGEEELFEQEPEGGGE
jgi:hypothetical protein